MRILLASTASFAPPRGGSTRGNRVWLEELTARGHECRVVCGTAPVANGEQEARVRREMEAQGVVPDGGRDMLLPSGIRVEAHRDLARAPGMLTEAIRGFHPDWVLVSSEDLSHSLLREASGAAPGRVIYLAHTPQFFPFGPESWSPDERAAARVRECAAVVAIGHHMAAYVSAHLGCEARVIHPNIYGRGPFESYSNLESGRVLLVNPCAVKGLPIFSALARRMPDVRFAALPGWGTTAQDRAEMAEIGNIAVLEPAARIEEVLEQTAVLLMPSLWYEGFGLIVMEAMLRGIPVIASDSGGLVEAKQGTGYVLAVAPIREYRAAFDEVHMPLAVIPAQNVDQWAGALRELLGDRAVYEQEAERCREAALDFVYGLRPRAMEELLLTLQPKPVTSHAELSRRLERLSPEQRALLAARVKGARVRT